jgi:hypothetical protein
MGGLRSKSYQVGRVEYQEVRKEGGGQDTRDGH